MPYFQVHVKYNIYLKVSIKYKYKYSSNLYLLHLSTSPTVLDPNPGLEEAREYEAGSEFLSFIEKRPHVSEELEDIHFEEFDPESE